AYFASNATAIASRKTSPRVNNKAVQKSQIFFQSCSNYFIVMDGREQPLYNMFMDGREQLLEFACYWSIYSLFRKYIIFMISRTSNFQLSGVVFESCGWLKFQVEALKGSNHWQRNDMVEYFGEQLQGFASTINGWVQSYGSRCVKAPIIYGDVSHPKPMTIFWSKYAQSFTNCPMKGMLSGPVTILNWSFERNDQSRSETSMRLALAIKEE
ncbi:hypothetical protein KI387_034758, partial [Taxus chinensis]